jgi:hypothetical protein
MDKTITLHLTGYTVKGIADLTLWGGDNACIEMRPFLIPDTKHKTILDNLNDNSFGVEAINGGICIIYENYGGFLQYFKTVTVGKISQQTTRYFEDNIGI